MLASKPAHFRELQKLFVGLGCFCAWLQAVAAVAAVEVELAVVQHLTMLQC